MCLKSLDKLSAPVYTSGMARGCFSSSDQYYFRHNRKHALKNADVVVALGVPLDFRLGYGFSINKEATLISVNKSKEDLNKNKKPDIRIHADPTRIMHEIGKIINPPSCQEWIDELSILENNSAGRHPTSVIQQRNVRFLPRRCPQFRMPLLLQ